VFGGNDELAQAFHQSYLLDNKGTGPAHKPWSELTQTYRNANREVADQAWARVHSSGFRAASSGNWTIDQDPQKFEALAEVIHRMWIIDRRLDGWRFGKVRDNQRRLHPDLCAFSKLPEKVKELDRAQIRLQQQVFRKDGLNVWPEVTVALSAKNNSALPNGLLDSLRDKFVTIVSAFETEAEKSMAEEISKASPSHRIFTFAKPALGAQVLHIKGDAKTWIAKRADFIAK
jgi:RyR domain